MASQRTRLLVIDHNPEVLAAVKDHLDGVAYEIEALSESTQAVSMVESWHPHIVLLDLETAGNNRFDILRRLKALDRDLAVIAISGIHDTAEVREVLDLGAEDFIAKPFEPALIEISMRNIRERRNLREQVSRLRGELDRDHAFGMMVGETSTVTALREFIEQVADTDLNILIRGESGTGKDVTSRLIHQLSTRHDGPFVKVNCAALPDNLIESELFGYEKGAFTGAVRAKPGRFQLAHGGTIFLDEITEIPFPLQSKLLQVLEQREFVSVGGTRTIHVDCRCIAATNANMEQMLVQQRFREDLFFRLNEFSVALPPLRERKEDIPLLVDYFLSLYSERYQRRRKSLSTATIHQMMEYPWPGNVRELESLLKRVIVLDSEEIIFQTIGGKGSFLDSTGFPGGVGIELPRTSGMRIQYPPGNGGVTEKGLALQRDPMGEGAMSSSIGQPDGGLGLSVGQVGPLGLKEIVDRAVETAERAAILDALNRAKWNRRKAAKYLKISYSSLLRRIERYNLETEP
jgi:DNA-binding NtrC family response regulator